MNVLYIFYILYFLISVAVIHLMARILSKTTTTFLHETFHGDGDLALLIDRVIIGSFFLANIGFVVSEAPYTNLANAGTRQAIPILLEKLGSAMLFIGFTLFLGLWIVARIRRLGVARLNNPVIARSEAR